VPRLRLALFVALCFWLWVGPTLAGTMDQVRAAETALTRGDLQTALKLYNQIIATGKLAREELAAIYVNRGITRRRLKRPAKAIADYTRALQLRPGYATALFNRGNAYADLRKFERAILDYDQAIKFRPTYAKAFYGRGNAHAHLKQLPQALDDYTQAIALNPGYALAYRNRAVVHKWMGDLDKARADWRHYKALTGK